MVSFITMNAKSSLSDVNNLEKKNKSILKNNISDA